MKCTSRLSLVLGLLLALAAAVTALPAASGDNPSETPPGLAKFHGKSDNGVYLVRLNGLPAVAYDGSIAGYAATKPNRGQKIDPRGADVQKYVGYLNGKHDKALSDVGGAKKLYDYDYTVDGFAARLSEAQALALATKKDVLSVEPDLVQHADTISSPAFLGLSQPGGTWDELGGVKNAGEGLVVGVIDTGIWPENPEFSDRTGTGPKGQGGKLDYQQIPGWHGKCTPGEAFNASNCNQKLIGAQYFVEGHGGPDSIIPEEYLSPRDFDGHGSHTASTAAGNNDTQVTGPGLPQALLGKVSGMAPRARIAAYKICWEKPDHSQVDCFTSDAVAAIDQAVADGVDAINYSVGGTQTSFLNAVEVAWLFAEDAGVFVANSAGNDGPAASTVAHPSPWITTVAASTHTAFEDTITLGNGATYTGTSIVPGVPKPAPLILASAAGLPGADPDKVRQCFSAAGNGGAAVLDPAKVTGKIVVCDRGNPTGNTAPANARVDKPAAVQEAGGVGTIIANVQPGAGQVADVHVAPATHVDNIAGAAIKAYAATTGATASFSDGRPVTPTTAPSIAGFSSRGPSAATGDQLTPDIAAPGVDVLAAVSPAGHGGRMWDLESGTSMSSPHIAGLSLLIKQKHPDWTPDMVKSAMMTTAYDLKSGDDPFAQGAGQVDPTKFLDPGLVYQSGGFNNYLGFICSTMGDSVSSACPQVKIRPNELNLPSIAIGALAGTDTLHRTVTNVSARTETYTASVSGLTGVNVTVSPASFTVAPGAAADYAVSFTEESAPFNAYAKGYLTLTGDQGHVVRIPVVVQPTKLKAPTEVTGSGTSGSVEYNVSSGYAGSLNRVIRGLQAATKFDNTVNGDAACSFDTTKPDDSVAAGTATVSTFTVPASSKYLRFQTFQADSSASVHDLDMYLYYKGPAASSFSFLTVSGGPDASEVISTSSATFNAEGGTFKVYVHGCGVDAGGGSFTLFAWSVTDPPSDPFADTPASPTAVTIGQTLTETFSWENLASGNRYLGRVSYSDPAASTPPLPSTVIAVSTR
jgi:hypothetical protein